MEFDNFRSHLPVFEKLCSQVKIKNALEFGPGMYSTPFLITKCQALLSIEQDDPKWCEKLKSDISAPNWHIMFCHYSKDPRSIFEQFDRAGQKFDLVFSDGAAQTRCLIANLAMQRNVPYIVLHDAEQIWYYKWNLLDIPASYFKFDFRSVHGAGKITSIIANRNYDQIESWTVPDHQRVLQVYSAPRQPVINLPYAYVKEVLKTSKLA